MSRVQVILLESSEQELARFDQETDRRYTVNELVEHPDDSDFWLVCAVDPAEPPYSERVTWLYVGRPES